MGGISIKPPVARTLTVGSTPTNWAILESLEPADSNGQTTGSATPFTRTYDNGTSGVGATLTNAGTLAAISIDGVALSLNDRVLVYQQTNDIYPS